MNTIQTTLSIFALAVSLAGTGCHSHCHWGDDPKAFRGMLDEHSNKLFDAVHATPAQRDAFTSIADRFAPEVTEAARAHNQLHAALITEWSRPSPDRER